VRERNHWTEVITESRIPAPRNDRAHPAARHVDWARIYEECRESMLGVAAQRLARIPGGGPEPGDIVHDVFADVLTQPPPDLTDWTAFLVEATVRRVAGLEEYAEDPVDGVPAPMVEDPAAVAVRRVQAAYTRARLTRVMDYMTERQREIAHLRLFEGRTVGQIAAAMGTSSSNISQIVTRCLTKLQPTLAQLETIDENDVTDLAPPRRVR
jgi:RNA polymerase sigma factor (sigma-70 family)